MQVVPLLVLASWFGLATAARKGGGGGGDSSENSDGNGGSSGGACDITGGYSYCSNPYIWPYMVGTGCGLGQCGCAMLNARQMLYGLPGLYYNGTLTVQHQIKDSAGWVKGGCNRTQGDNELKTNKYPALLFIGPSGNESDTNPIHWSLYGFQPGEDTQDTDIPYVDLNQKWFLVRSSDFVPTGDYCFTNTGVYPFYGNSDMSGTVQTRVYWETNVTDSGDNTFSAEAKLINMSPSFGEISSTSIPTVDYQYKDNNTFVSNYFTLRNVCNLSQAYYRRTNGTPTVWFKKGTTAKITSIGSERATFSINDTLDRAPAFQNRRAATCGKGTGLTGYETSHQSNTDNEQQDWGLSVAIGLTFEGTIVQENSTQIHDTRDGKPISSKTYNRTIKTGKNSDYCGGASQIPIGLETWLLGFFAVALIHWAF